MEENLGRKRYQIPEARDLNFREVQGAAACKSGSKVSKVGQSTGGKAGKVRPMGNCASGDSPHGNCAPQGTSNVGYSDHCRSGSVQAYGCNPGYDV
jgi:hypothetical protein